MSLSHHTPPLRLPSSVPYASHTYQITPYNEWGKIIHPGVCSVRCPAHWTRLELRQEMKKQWPQIREIFSLWRPELEGKLPDYNFTIPDPLPGTTTTGAQGRTLPAPSCPQKGPPSLLRQEAEKKTTNTGNVPRRPTEEQMQMVLDLEQLLIKTQDDHA